MFRTQKRVAAEAELPSHQLILRAGLARRVSSGIYSLTPLAVRAVHHIETIIREEMDRIGGQEVLLPFVQPAELWQESERYDAMGSDLARLKDRAEHPMVLAWTHEEAVTDLARSVVESYRQLPQLVYQVQSKFRDEPRPRGGLVRLREFLMKDAYSFHTSQEDLDAWYERIVEAYLAIYRRLELPILIVEADTGMMGGKSAHEFMFLADGGEDTLVVCPTGDYAANQEIAVARKGERSHKTDDEALREVHTPGATTIAALCVTLNCAPEDTLKSVFYAAGDELILALIRGDLEVNEVKLRNLLHQDVRALSREEAAAFGLVAGYAGPVGLSAKARIVVDDSVPEAGGLISGANRMDHHLAGVTYWRYRSSGAGDGLRALRDAAGGAARHRGGEYLQAGDTLQRDDERALSGRARRLAADGNGLLWPGYHPRAGLHSGAASRRRRHCLAAQRRAVHLSPALGRNGRGDLPSRRSCLHLARRAGHPLRRPRAQRWRQAQGRRPARHAATHHRQCALARGWRRGVAPPRKR
jgi:prolyl-tRNA synthetase family II